MINNIFPLVIQAAVQSAQDSPIATAYQASAAWIDDEIALFVFGY